MYLTHLEISQMFSVKKKIVAWVTLDLFQVSKTWRRLASRDELWQAKCQETYVGEFWIKCQFVLFCFVSKLVMNNLPRDKKCSHPHFRTFKEIGYNRYLYLVNGRLEYYRPIISNAQVHPNDSRNLCAESLSPFPLWFLEWEIHSSGMSE